MKVVPRKSGAARGNRDQWREGTGIGGVERNPGAEPRSESGQGHSQGGSEGPLAGTGKCPAGDGGEGWMSALSTGDFPCGRARLYLLEPKASSARLRLEMSWLLMKAGGFSFLLGSL